MVIQKNVRTFLMRRKFKRVLRGIILVQSHYRRRKARLQLKLLKVKARVGLFRLQLISGSRYLSESDKNGSELHCLMGFVTCQDSDFNLVSPM